MTFGGKPAIILLFIGDALAFALSLWLTLLFRYGEVPGALVLSLHVPPFLLLFLLWALVFYMSGLYGKRAVLFKKSLFGAILRTQLLNIVLAALFFFFAPGIAIEPKTNLILYLAFSLGLILLWRTIIFPRLSRPAARERAALIAAGCEAEELSAEVNGNPRYQLEFVAVAAPKELAQDFDSFAARLKENGITTLIIDMDDDALRPLLSRVYRLAFEDARYQVFDFYAIYEEVFDRVPLSLLQYEWFLKNVTTMDSGFYGAAKRAIDIVGGLLMGLITLIATPFIWLSMRLEGPGPVFIEQDRIGQFGSRVKAYKFRSMRTNKSASSEWTVEEKRDNPVTRVGSFLRMTSLDEFPQFLNVLKGELSLIGPRNDVEGLGARLAEAIPYYGLRYVARPGITGWAQINQQYEQGHISPQSIEETKVRLAYDFYYIKNRSLTLDIVIALKTVKRMLFRVSGTI